MTLVVDIHHAPPGEWDAWVTSAGGGAGLLQSTFWGSLMQSLGRGSPLYLAVKDGEDVVALLLAVHDSHPATGRRPYLRLLSSLAGMGRIEFSDGPVIMDASLAGPALDALLDWLSRYAARNRVRLIRSGGLSPLSCLADDQGLAATFMAHGYDRMPWATYVVDLRPEEEALFMSLDHAARKGIKKAGREGVRIRAVSGWEDFLNAFLLPYKGWSRPGADLSGEIAEARRVWEHPRHDELYRYYVAEADDGTVLAVLGMCLFNHVATEVTSGVAPAAVERKLPAQDLLHWEMFLEAKRLGCHSFNLAGVAPEPGSSKEENIRRFKKKWGGRYLQYDRFEWRHWLVRRAVGLKAWTRRNSVRTGAGSTAPG